MNEYFCCALCGGICAPRPPGQVSEASDSDGTDEDIDDEEDSEPSRSPVHEEGPPNHWLQNFRGVGFDDERSSQNSYKYDNQVIVTL